MKALRSAAVGLAGLAALVGGAVAATDISDYTVYGDKGVFIGVGTKVYGLTGARTNDPIAGAAIKLNGGASIIGDARSGDDVNLQNNAHITDVLYRQTGSTLTMGSGSSVGGDIVGNPDLPVMPPATPLTCPTGGANYTGANSQSLAIGPGTYGALKYGGGFILILNGSGDYYFDSIVTGNGAKLFVTQPDVRVFVCGAAQFGSIDVFPTNLSPCDFSVEVQAAGVNAFKAAGGSHWIGSVFAPNGQIHVGSGSSAGGTVLGPLVGQSIDLEHGLIVTNVPCVAPGCAAPCIFGARLLANRELEITGSNLGVLKCIILIDVNNDVMSLGQLQCGSGDCDVPVLDGVNTALSGNTQGDDVLTTLAPIACGQGTYRVILDYGSAKAVTEFTVHVP